ncbi:nucleoside-diphosphate sugar epimerase/dehydratase [Marinobacterium sp. xm-m-312]|uniref:polysaccharide biosynthesis protein n=1 Tax=Marinobacterium sp. xm-m-312 TaxID=2497741 RepID=UPI00156921B5|nr:nucleoside-diphosphate sugar epimerase/dehydratase [Marinobacterium sp. xm-m-312]NRQ22364.1 UDP-N-acetyl-alpha-D-glucosamine C6 dehydratase [Marinobacterium sp. xm-m-312]
MDLFAGFLNTPIIFGLTAWLYLGGSRLILRSYYHWLSSHVAKENVTVIYGAGSAGAQLALSLQAGGQLYPVAFVDDDPKLHKNYVCGLKVYSPASLQKLIEKKNVGTVLLAMINISSVQRRSILESLSSFPVEVKTMPTMPELLSGRALDEFREVEIEDLLGREVVEPDSSLITKSIFNKSVCVTGAGGSIGSELARQALINGAKTLVLIDHSEWALYEIERELATIALQQQSSVRLIPILASVLDANRVESALRKFEVDTVFHAAAYKHVPLVEHNVLQGLANNTLGTMSIAKVASSVGVERFILVSTDKAVRPTNIMGATKRFAELCVQALALNAANQTCFSMVRFGNVLGSSGSVVPLFNEQIHKGGPITVTHPEVNRYFMTIPEAASLVIQAGSLAQGGEVFVLDMGEPIKIAQLAKNMIRLSGLTLKSEQETDGDIEIVYTGLRPGEKLYEELLIGDDVIPTPHPKILCARERYLPLVEIERLLELVKKAIDQNDTQAARDILTKAVTEFKVSTEDADWLSNSVTAPVSSSYH